MNHPPSTATEYNWSDPLQSATRMMTELTHQMKSDDFATCLTRHLRRQTGAQRVILMSRRKNPGECCIKSESARDDAVVLTAEQLAELCPICSSHTLPTQIRNLEPGHPLEQLLHEKKIKSLLRLPLQCDSQLEGALILINLPKLEQIELINNVLEYLKPYFCMGLCNSRSNETILRQNEQLEIEVEKRTAELEQINRELADSRLAALNMMEDAILAQDKMAFQNKLFSSFMDSLPANVFFQDTESRLISVNTSFAEYFQVSPQELIGKSLSDLLPAQDAEICRKSDLQCMERGQAIQEEQYIGGRWWMAVKVPRYDEAGQMIGCYGISWDITGRKEADADLQHSREQFASLLSNLPGMAYRCNNDEYWTMRFISAGCTEITGYTPAELTENKTLSFNDLIHPDDRRMVAAEVQNALENEQHFELEYRLINRDHQERWVWERGLGRVDEQGRGIIEGFITDITHRKEIEQALLESEKTRSEWLARSPTCTKILDLDFNLQFMSEAGIRILQIPDVTELHGKPYPFNFFPESFNRPMLAALKKARNTGQPVTNEGWVPTPDGNQICFSAQITPVKDDEGQLDYIMVISTDITERKQLQDALEKRINSLTRPRNNGESIEFEELFNLAEIQNIQNQFSAATSVASIITRPDGTPLTKASNFTRFCMKIVRNTEKGCANCQKSDAALGRYNPEHPIVQPCLSSGLWDAGASIEVGGQHVANWLIGQVRDGTQTEEQMRAYAREIGADEAEFIEAFYEVPIMPHEQFEKIASALHTLANQLSKMAYQNIQQARFITERKKAAAKIADLARFTEENTNPVMRISRDGLLLYANRAAGGLLAEADREIGKPIPAKWYQFIRNSMQTGQDLKTELTYESHVFSVTLAPIPEHDYVNVYAHDITDRVEAERQQEEAQRLLRSIIDAIPIRVFWKDINSVYLGCNSAFANDNHLADPAELEGKSAFEMEWSTEQAQIYCSEDRAIMDAGTARLNYEEIKYNADGTPRWLNTSKIPLRDAQGNISGILGVYEIITERKQAEIELLRLSTAIEQSPESVVITDTEGAIQYVNPGFERTTGYTREEVLGSTPKLLKSDLHDQHFYAELWDTLRAGKNWEGRLINRRKDGSLFTEEATISPVRNPDGQITNYVAVKRDISEELAREEELRQSQKMEAVGQLAGGVAHDFNNILQAVLGFSEILMMRFDKDSLDHRNAFEIHKSAQRAAELTRQLLAFSRKQPAEMALLNLNDTLYDAEALLDMLLGDNYEITMDLAEELPQIRSDRGQLTQVIMNLAVNARDAMPEGGGLSITTQLVSNPESDSQKHPGHYICLSVSDTGIGMNKETRKKLFDPFFTTKEIGKGTGLGLSVVYGIITQNDGWINVQSQPGEGTRFDLFFPIPSDGAPAIQPTPSKAGCRILLVEDDQQTRNFFIRILEKAAYEVVAFKDAEQALAYYQDHAPSISLLITDMVLPGMSGIALADQIRTLTDSLPVLICSGYSDQMKNWQELETKHYQFMEKPITVTEFLAAVHNTCTAANSKLKE